MQLSLACWLSNIPEGRRHFDTSTCDAAMEWRDAETSSCASIYSAQLAMPALAFHLPL
jgi:hypothetical protein